MNSSDVDREQRTFEAVPTSAAAARRFVTEILRHHGAPNGVVGDFALVVSELSTNIIEHGDGSSLVIFVDVSDLGPRLRHSVGAGLRYGSPVGLVRLDFGFPLGRRPGERPYQWFFSLGQAF